MFAAYPNRSRQARALLAGPETAAPGRGLLNARAHLLLSVIHALTAWIGRDATDDHHWVARRVSDLLLSGLAGAGQQLLGCKQFAPGGRIDRPPIDAGR